MSTQRQALGAEAAARPTDGRKGAIYDHLELLAEMGQEFASSRDIQASLAHAIEHITEYVDAEGGALFLLDDGGRTLCCQACFGPTEITGLTLKSDQGIVGRCVQSNRGEIVREAAKDPNFHSQIDATTGFTTRSILCAPMSVKGERVGAIELINKRGGDGLFAEADLHLLQALSASAALAILNARMAEELVEQERVARELELAAEIQRSLLPKADSKEFPVAGVNHAARTVSGDFYDFFTLEDGRICFNLGDVSGKGMNAALLMAKTASVFRCLGKSLHQPGELLDRINVEICETVTRGMFVTMVGGLYDPQTGVVRLANAGHEPPLFHDTAGAFTSLPADAPPIGILPSLGDGESYPEIELSLDGGTLYIFTDGVTEGYLEDGRELEVGGLKKLIVENATAAPGDRLAAVIARIDRGNTALRDDLTMIVIDDRAACARRRAAEAAPKRYAAAKARPRPAAGDEAVLLKISVPSQPDRLKLIRAAVSETTRLCGCADDIGRDIVIAVDEACQNIIRHAYGGSPDGEISLEIRRRGGALEFLIRDFAETIDVSAVKPRDLDDIRPGGLGTHFIREVMDEVTFLPPPGGGGNLLRLVKRLS